MPVIEEEIYEPFDSGTAPSFSIKELNTFGEMTISFTDSMKVVNDLSLINDQVLDVRLLPDVLNNSEDPNAFKFTWTITEFKSRYMKLQFLFESIYQISAGVKRDVISVKVLENELFFSAS